MKCHHYRIAEMELNRLTQALLYERDPEQRATIRSLMIAQGKQMDAHRNCDCKEKAA